MLNKKKYGPDSFEMKSLDSLARRLRHDKEAVELIDAIKGLIHAQKIGFDTHVGLVKTYENLLGVYQETGMCRPLSFEHVTLRVALLGKYEYNEN